MISPYYTHSRNFVGYIAATKPSAFANRPWIAQVRTQPRSPVLENYTPGSVRGASANRRSYRKHPILADSGARLRFDTGDSQENLTNETS